MTQVEPASHNTGVETGDSSVAGRRNLPRSSHACQRCRAKKSKCNQQQPCSHCIKHATTCVYGIRRRNGRSKNSSRVEDHGSAHQSDIQHLCPHSAPLEAGYDPASGLLHHLNDNSSVENNISPHQNHGSVRSGKPQPVLSQESQVLIDPSQALNNKHCQRMTMMYLATSINTPVGSNSTAHHRIMCSSINCSRMLGSIFTPGTLDRTIVTKHLTYHLPSSRANGDRVWERRLRAMIETLF